ncbi:hypothetical protein [uncultured Bradyrhizobium sp.]|mgnify:CR=1 FL=1|uniref:hypothetical protein n=1 Tax=uncultured Bradyrhizobium sp. TaxID=199684 RepID=UPI002608444E|nr:hypothetical protein [uncultured Bradyrhizobium sp.]
MFKRVCAVALSFLMVHAQIAPTLAQSATPPEQLSTLQTEVQDLKSQNARIEAYLQQLTASVGQLQTMSLYSTDEGKKAAAKNATAQKEDAGKGVELINNIPDRVLGPELKTGLKDCIGALNQDGSKLLDKNAAAIANPLATCNEETVKGLQQELQKKKDQLVSSWQKCRDVIAPANPDLSLAIPDVPTNLTPEGIKQVQTNIEDASRKLSDLGKKAGQCTSQMQDILQDLGDVAKAGDALSASLGFAAQACFASGANPYVCAGFAVLAILMSLFGGGKGNGKGDGKGNSMAGLPGGSVPGPSPQPITTNFMGDQKSGGVLCNRLDTLFTCWTVAKPDQKTAMDFKVIDPNTANADSAKWFKEVLNSGGSNGRLFFCSDAGGKITRVVVSSSDRKNHSNVDVKDAEDPASKAHPLVFNTKTEQHDPADRDQLCPL